MQLTVAILMIAVHKSMSEEQNSMDKETAADDESAVTRKIC